MVFQCLPSLCVAAITGPTLRIHCLEIQAVTRLPALSRPERSSRRVDSPELDRARLPRLALAML
jgi:hypothetical protein